MPIYVGGHTDAALKRAARVGGGWTWAMMRIQDLRTTIACLAELRAEYGRTETAFEIQAVCTNRFGLDGYREQADAIVVPWFFYGSGWDADLVTKQDGIRRFADDVIAHMA